MPQSIAATGNADIIDQQPTPIEQTIAQFVEPVVCFVGTSDIKLWGMTPVERTRKLFGPDFPKKVISLEKARSYEGPIILIRADAVFDGVLVQSILKRPNFVLLSSNDANGGFIAANIRSADIDAVLTLPHANAAAYPTNLIIRSPHELDVSFKKTLVKREVPFAIRLKPENVDQVEWNMFMSTYKGATDLVTKHVWPVPAYFVTRVLASRGISPNLVTSVGAIAMLIAFYLFLHGHYWSGLGFAWLMTFLDTVDGKLARTTLSSSKWGDIFDHGIDLVHPPFWYLAWIFGLETWGFIWSQDKIILILAIIFGGYILQRVIEGIAIKWLKLVIHIWRPIDTLFRKVTARRNPNLVILTASMFVARPDWGIVAVAAWTAICLALHGVQLAQALAKTSRTKAPLKSWMDRS